MDQFILNELMNNSEEEEVEERILENFLLSSSSSDSSSSESDNGDYHAKIEDYMAVIRNYSEKDFRSHFRLNRKTVLYLIGLYETSGYPPTHHHGGREKVGADKEIYITIWYLSNTETFRQIADRFGIGKGTCWVVVNRTLTWIVSLSSEFISWPNAEEQNKISSNFEAQYNIPGIIGIIDCSHIKIKAPRVDPIAYFNYKKYYSLKIQAVTDLQRRFIDIYVGEAGSLHDLRVFRRSPIFERVQNNYRAFFPENSFILGDTAYQPSNWVVVPYKDRPSLSVVQRNFNKAISQPRVKVEHCFGVTKARFRRILHFTENDKIPFIVNVIVAVCVLHNICILQNDDFWDEDDEEELLDGDQDEDNTNNEGGNNDVVAGTDRRLSLIPELLRRGAI